jgi:hypothetical protein
MTEAYEIIEHVVIAGVGGAGLRAALGMAASGWQTALRIPVGYALGASRKRNSCVRPSRRARLQSERKGRA